MALQTEVLPAAQTWWRIADRSWRDPLDPQFSMRRGARWNAAGSFPALYLNEDQVTARLNLRAFIAHWPYEPEDLRDASGPVLVGARLPRRQRVADIHSALGVVRAGLHPNYPNDAAGEAVTHHACQVIGARVHAAGLRGVRTRSAQTRDGAGRELAWFPAGPASRARMTARVPFERWFWA